LTAFVFLSISLSACISIFYFILPTSRSTSAILVYSFDGSSSNTFNNSSISSTSALDIFSLAYSLKPSFDFGKSIPDRTFAIVAAEIDEEITAVLPPFLLGCSDALTSAAVLTFLPLFNSPNAIATSAVSIGTRWKRLYQIKKILTYS
jgi:hypothetical protein